MPTALLFIIPFLIWSSSFIMMKWAMGSFGPLFIAAASTGIGGVISAVVARKNIDMHQLGPKLPALALIALLGFVIPFALQPWLIVQIGHGYVASFQSLVPIITVVVTFILFGRKSNQREISTIIAGLVFMSLLAYDGTRRTAQGYMVALALVIPVCYSVANAYISRLGTLVGPIQISAFAQCIASALLFAVALIFEEMPESISLRSVLAVVYLGIGSRGIATILFFVLLRRQGAVKAGMITYLVPLGALVWSYLDHETVSLIQVVAICGVLGSVWLVTFSPLALKK